MPKRQTIHIGGVKDSAVNIDFKVGAGGDNGIADVMLIQALFHLISSYSPKTFFLGFPIRERPAITGICDWKTNQAILKFQRQNAKRLLAVDGLVHPAAYDGRTIKGGETRVMAMTLLHYYASDAAVFRNEPHYIDSLIKIAPQLRQWLS